MSIRDLQDAPAPAEDVVWIKMLGAAGAEHKSLARQLKAAEARESDTFAGSGAHATAAARMRQIEDSAGLTGFCLRALERTRPLTLVRDHLPETAEEKAQGFAEAYAEAMIRESCWQFIDPDGATIPAAEVTWWDNIFASLSWGQFQELWEAVNVLNGNDKTLPSYLGSRLADIPGQRWELEQAQAWGVSPKRFAGWEPTYITDIVRDDTGRIVRLVQTVAEPEWDRSTRDWAHALGWYRDGLCPLCGRPRDVCQAATNEDAFEVDAPTRCHATTARLRAEEAMPDDTRQRHALLFSTVLREG